MVHRMSRVIQLAKKDRDQQNISIKNTAIAYKPRDEFIGQSRSPNMVPFHK